MSHHEQSTTRSGSKRRDIPIINQDGHPPRIANPDPGSDDDTPPSYHTVDGHSPSMTGMATPDTEADDDNPPSYYTVDGRPLGMGNTDTESDGHTLPSYDAVILQEHCERLLKFTGSPLHGLAECLRNLEPSSSSETSTMSEESVRKSTAAFHRIGETCTVECAQRYPMLIEGRVRQFLLSCVARDMDVDLILLENGMKVAFIRLLEAYETSWRHKITYGWEGTDIETQLSAYRLFYHFIEIPLRKLRIPISAFLWHARVHRSVYRLPQESSLSERPLGFSGSTLQAMRLRGELSRLEELLRMNELILDRARDGLHLHPQIYRACKKEIAAERRAYIPPHLCNTNKFQYTMTYHPTWTRFERISDNGLVEFPPLYPKQPSSDPLPADIPESSTISTELEYNPWT